MGDVRDMRGRDLQSARAGQARHRRATGARVEIKLADDGEVMVKGDSVMPGYRNMPEKNAETITEDGLLTGDIGEIDEDGYLKIVDRKKELIINAAGKNMSPANIEVKLKLIPLVDQAVAIGDWRKYVTALLTLWTRTRPPRGRTRTKEPDLAALAEDDELLAEVETGVKEANEALARVEQVKQFRILPGAVGAGGDELTPTMKLKRGRSPTSTRTRSTRSTPTDPQRPPTSSPGSLSLTQVEWPTVTMSTWPPSARCGWGCPDRRRRPWQCRR